LTGKTALVTGGNTGLGRAIALALAGADAEVALTYFSHPGKETAAAIRALGRKSLALWLDATDSAGPDPGDAVSRHVQHRRRQAGDDCHDPAPARRGAGRRGRRGTVFGVGPGELYHRGDHRNQRRSVVQVEGSFLWDFIEVGGA